MTTKLKWCQGTLAAVPTGANICASTLNMGSSGDPGALQSAVPREDKQYQVYILGTAADTIC
jgi:hypothetical protein